MEGSTSCNIRINTIEKVDVSSLMARGGQRDKTKYSNLAFLFDESGHVSGNVKRPHPLALGSQRDQLWKREHSLYTKNNVKLSSSCSTASAQSSTARVRHISRVMSDSLHVVPLSLKTLATYTYCMARSRRGHDPPCHPN